MLQFPNLFVDSLERVEECLALVLGTADRNELVEAVAVACHDNYTWLADKRTRKRRVIARSELRLCCLGLGGALRRLTQTQWAAEGLRVNVRVAETVALPMHLQTALLRIAQGAIANVIQHAHATAATITLVTDQDNGA